MRERPVENTVEMLGELVERKGRGEEEEKRNLAIFKGVLAFLGVEEVILFVFGRKKSNNSKGEQP